MNADEFIDALDRLSPEDIGLAATTLRTVRDSAGDEIAWWEAEVVVTGVLRASHQRMASRLAARRASDALVHAARAAHVALSEEEIRSVARGAADVALALVAGKAANAQAAYLLDRLGWTERFSRGEGPRRSIPSNAA